MRFSYQINLQFILIGAIKIESKQAGKIQSFSHLEIYKKGTILNQSCFSRAPDRVVNSVFAKDLDARDRPNLSKTDLQFDDFDILFDLICRGAQRLQIGIRQGNF